ncbi:MAG: triphosphoribosyl-dephospho-CoA synthase [Rhodospirillales bacterium]
MSGHAVGARASRVGEAVRDACLGELAALKPGNVHVYADGHGMTVEDFQKSAAVTAEVLGRPGLSVGERIQGSVEATRAAVGCNTNLGIVLLCAPLAHAALAGGAGAGLRAGVRTVLDALDVADAELAYRAIRLAVPAGLGSSDRHDVRQRPTVTLLDAMNEARDRDRIARQYATAFEDVFGFGVPRLEEAMGRWNSDAWATTSVYLGFLGQFADSHIARTGGAAAAETVRRKAAVLDRRFERCRRPPDMRRALLDFDAELKAAEQNPGTSADLTVATLLARRLAGADDPARR